jgi:plasmid stabilization system protein ParE
MRIEWVAEAATELDRMLAFIAAQDVRAAALVVERGLQAERAIVTFPAAGRYDTATKTFDRYIPKTRIVLTYALRGETIWVISVWHTSRNPADKPTLGV